MSYDVSRTIDEHGTTYTHPHRPRLDEELDAYPGDLSRATEWERREIVKWWVEAIQAAQDLHHCASIHLSALYVHGQGERRLVGGGTPIPSDRANVLTVALTALHHVHQGMLHRLALEDRKGK